MCDVFRRTPPVLMTVMSDLMLCLTCTIPVLFPTWVFACGSAIEVLCIPKLLLLTRMTHIHITGIAETLSRYIACTHVRINTLNGKTFIDVYWYLSS
jgi:hypothetical protein